MPTAYGYGNDHHHNWCPPNVGEPNDCPVPDDLMRHHRQISAHNWAYVCPHCKMIFEPGWGGMPESFRKHVTDPDYGGQGCVLKPPAKEDKRKGKTKGLEAFE